MPTDKTKYTSPLPAATEYSDSELPTDQFYVIVKRLGENLPIQNKREEIKMALRLVSLIALILSLTACTQYENKRGVTVLWQPSMLAQLERGVSTRADILDKLGPPSQIITSGDQTALYYLNENARGSGLLLFVYNKVEVDTQYDRAVFFFDDQDLLTDFSAYIRP